jgi:hypothetical protein
VLYTFFVKSEKFGGGNGMRIIYKKGMSIILVMMMLMGGLNGLFVGGNKAYAAVAFAGGTGEESNPYQIATAAQLNEVRNRVGTGIYFELIADINLSTFTAADGLGWKPLSSFYGVMDGNGFKISDLTINRPASNGIGLFERIKNSGVIKNVILENINVKGNQYTGGLAAYNSGAISSSSVTGSVYGTDGVGGLVGFNDGGTISNSYATGGASGELVGGLVGYNIGTTSNSYATGSVTGLNYYAGGFAGYNAGTISNSYATGDVSGGGIGGVGGLVGFNEEGTISNSYASGVGNLVGENSGIVTISSYVLPAAMQDINTFIGWDFENHWYIIPNHNPQLWAFTALTPGTDIGTTKLNRVPNNMEYKIGNGSYTNTSFDNIIVNAGDLITLRIVGTTPTSPKTLTVGVTNIKPAAAPTAGLTVGTNVIGSTKLTGVADAMEYKVNTGSYLTITGTSVDDIAVVEGDQIYVRVRETATQPASTAQVLIVGSGNIMTVPIATAAIAGVTAPVTFDTPVSSITPTAEYTGSVAWSPSDGIFEGAKTYTATITLAPKSGYTFSDVTANFFTVAGAITTTNSAQAGVITAVFPATARAFSGGSGTIEDPYQIATADQLDKVRYYLSANFKLIADINLSDYPENDSEGWMPIGADSDYAFEGRLDGNGYKITNLTINRPNSVGQGLFFDISTNSVITNLILENVNVGGRRFVGGLAGFNEGTISNSYVTGNVEVRGNEDSVGGLVGLNSGGTISSSYATGSVSGSAYVGGLVGQNTVTEDEIGTISSSYAAGDVSGNIEVGGLVGFNEGEVSSSFYDSETSVQPLGDTGKGFGLSTIEMQDKTSFIGWDFEAVWYMVSGQYPHLRALIATSTIAGVTAPVTNATPVSSIAPTAEYTATIAWSPVAATFAARSAYTATITLTPKTGYTLTGVTENFFTVAGATTTTNSANAGVVTAVFPATVAVPEGGTPPSNGGGGSPTPTPTNVVVTSTVGNITLPAGRSGEVSLGDAITINIPADATGKEMKLTIEKVLNTENLLTNEEVLASPIYEILKNFSENFTKPVTLTFVFDPSSLKSNQRAVVFYYDEVKKVWVEVGGKVSGDKITVDVNHFTKFAVLAVDQAVDVPTDTTTDHIFSDISGHWAETSIKQAVSSGIVKGYLDGTFKPSSTVTRAEFAVMLMNALKPQGEGAELTFTDKVKIGTWAQKAVSQAVQAGIIKGHTNGTFGPNAEITRAEMAAMIAIALGQSIEANVVTGFADEEDIPAWAKGSIAYMKQAGIMQGKSDNEFAPQDHATRAEAVTVLLNMLVQMSK